MKIHIYQIFTRLFGNKNNLNKHNGGIEENGCGKFNDINDAALKSIKHLGMSHVWYTGVLEHASLTSYPEAGIAADHPDFVKGKAGSPYAIRDYYDVCPDLAIDANKRMEEFENLLARTHQNGLKALIDFVPNHVSRAYASDAKPSDERDLGDDDDTSMSFDPQNNFYYLPGESLQLPIMSEGISSFAENPAKVTGNDCFSATPSINDWYETVKLNYGIDYMGGQIEHFNPIPNTWVKMTNILLYWAKKGVDGFRCDMAEMVPVEFWHYAISSVKAQFPNIIFVAEVYDPEQYRRYIHVGNFDLLYDKVGLYDTLKGIIEGHKWANDISSCWQKVDDIKEHILNFMENHDEQRIASHYFATNPWRALPAVTVASCMEKSSYMQYFAQELGERAEESEGFSGADGRTTIFDYWGLKTQQAWMNQGSFDGEGLTVEEAKLRKAYQHLLSFALENQTVQKGAFYDLQWANRDNVNYDSQHIYSFLRYTEEELLLFIVNFSTQSQRVTMIVPDDARKLSAYHHESTGTVIYTTATTVGSKVDSHSFVLDGNGVLIVKYR